MLFNPKDLTFLAQLTFASFTFSYLINYNRFNKPSHSKRLGCYCEDCFKPPKN